MSNQLGNSNKGKEYIKQLTTFELKSEISEIKNLLYKLNKSFIIYLFIYIFYNIYILLYNIEESTNSKILN